MYTYLYVYVYIHTYMYVRAYVHTCMYAHTYVHVCMYVCTWRFPWVPCYGAPPRNGAKDRKILLEHYLYTKYETHLIILIT